MRPRWWLSCVAVVLLLWLVVLSYQVSEQRSQIERLRLGNEGDLSEIRGSVAGVAADLARLNGEADRDREAVTNLAGDVGRLEGRADQYGSEVTALGGRVGDAINAVSAMTSRIKGHEGRLDALDGEAVRWTGM